MSAEGRLIAGRYRLHQRIGSGAMGEVWRAVDERLQRTVAVKLLLLQPGYTEAETQEARQRSMREGRIAARLQHQNAIAVFDVAEEDGRPVLVMEYLPSESLASVIAERGVLPPLEVARIGAQVAGALAAAHAAGIVHRDLKPGNILLGGNGISKITDFGISRAVGDVAVTKSGILAGTPAYLSPEVALGRDPAPASDVFSLGATLYAALEGSPPFGVDDNAISLLHRVSRGQIEPPRNAGPMTAALMQLLRPDPVDRPTMAQVQELLQAVTEGRPVPNTATPAGGWQQPHSAETHGPARPQSPGATRVAPATASNPPTRYGAPPGSSGAAAAEGETGRARTGLLWTAAVTAAILVGVLVASAFAAGGGGNDPGNSPAPPATSAPESAPSSAPATTSEVATTTEAPPTTTSAPPTTSEQKQPESEQAAEEKSERGKDKGKKKKKGEVSSQELEQTVARYFSLVPDELDRSWKLLGPQLKSVGRDQYEEFWDSVEDVEIVSGPRAIGDNRVVATLRYKTEDDGTSVERHVYGMIVRGGQALINTEE